MAARPALLLALLCAAAVLWAAPAQAAFRPCPGAHEADCARVGVPLDHSGTVPGRLRLQVVRFPAPRETGHAVLYLAGGPGSAGVSEFVSALTFDDPIGRLADDYDLVSFDQRGTGGSGLLRCPALENDTRLRATAAAEECARRLGAKRAFYTTRDSVEDVELVRRALGVDKLFLYGVSYGTKLALAYARAYPEHVEKMLLDSVLEPDEHDEFGIESWQALGPSLLGLCPDGCAGVTPDPVADVAALTARLEQQPLRGLVYRTRGRPFTSTLTPVDVADFAFDADYDPALRAGVPAAVQGALKYGDAAPLLRLIERAVPLGELPPPREFSTARYATVCEETPLPWPRGAPFDQRLAEAQRRFAALGPDVVRPFDFDVARADEIDLCLRWPEASAAPALRGTAYPAVPTLILQGGEDLRTPSPASERVAAAIPGSLRLVVPGVGHAVLAADLSGCSSRQTLRWLRGQAPRECPRVPTRVPAEPVLPPSLGDVPVADGLAGRDAQVARTVAAIGLTLQDVAFARSPGAGQSGGGPGLRGGRFRARRGRLSMLRLQVVRGLRLTGSSTARGTLRLRVGGSAAASGRVTVTRRGRLSGRLGGRRVSARLPSAGRPPAVPARVARVARAAAAFAR